MYVVAIFALALLSPLPFVSPFVYDVQNVEAQTPFGTGSQDNDLSPPLQTSTQELDPYDLTSSSDNANQAYAKAGDTITVTFRADDALHYNATATIHGKNASVSIFNDTLSATITVLNTDPDGYANFEINVSNDFGKISVSDVNLTSGDVVFVDKHVPVIKINGPHLIYVTQGESYTDEFGASVSDADPAYSHTPTSDTSVIDTTTIGTYTLEYISPEDGAGNAPFIKTRTVSVQSSSLTAEASYVDTETILLRFDTSAPAFYSGSTDLASAVTVDGQNVNSAFISGQVKSVAVIDNTIPDLAFLGPGVEFGTSVAHMGDLNQDGYADVAVGIIYHVSNTSIKYGAIAILYLDENAQSVLDVFVHDADTPNMPILYDRNPEYLTIFDAGDEFGSSLAYLGDVNGDGFPDIAVGTPLRSFAGEPYGGVYTIFLGPNGTSVLGYAEIDHILQNGPQHDKGTHFGRAIVNMGDLNGDGINDIAVTAPEASHEVSGQAEPEIFGFVHIMHLGSDGLPIKSISYNMSAVESQFPSIVPASNTRTWGIANMGDLNGDGFTDLALTSYYFVDQGVLGDNFIYILHLGENGESVLDLNQIPLHGGNMPPEPAVPKFITYGHAIEKLEDLNGDGYTDLLISAPDALDPFGSVKGVLYVVLLGENGTSALGYYEIRQNTTADLDLTPKGFEYQNGSRVGSSMTVLGDVNSDGALDIMVGANLFGGIAFDRQRVGQGSLHSFSLAGPDDEVAHVVIKPDVIANTNTTSTVVFDPVSANLNLRSLSTSSVSVQTSDNIAPVISNITTLTNTSLNVEFSEDIETDTEFGINSFRVSGTDKHVYVKSVSQTSGNTVLLDVSHISGTDEPLVEIFDSAIKDDKGNIIEYALQTTENMIGSYPISAFWGYNSSDTRNAPVLIVLFESIIEQASRENYKINITQFNIPNRDILDDSASVISQDADIDLYQTIRYIRSSIELPFMLNTPNLEITLSPNDAFLDLQGDPFLENHTLPVETLQPPKLLSAETREGRYIAISLNRYVELPSTTAFSVSDSLSVDNVTLSGTEIILDLGPTSVRTDITPTVTITGTVTDKNGSSDDFGIPWYDFEHQDVVVGSEITAVDGSNPIILTAEYDNNLKVNVSYSEPIIASTVNEDDFEPYYEIEKTVTTLVKATSVKRITNIETAADNMSSVLTFDKRLNPDGFLRMVGSISDLTGSVMPYQSVPVSDTTPPTMSSAKTVTSTSIEIQFDEDIIGTTVNASDFTVSDSITVSSVTAVGVVLGNVVLLHTTIIPEDATPTVTLVNDIEDRVGNVINSDSLIATDAITPSLSSLSIISDNTNTGFAKSEDEITLKLVANEPVSYVTGSIYETTPQITVTSNGFDASVTITDTTSNGEPTFAITIVDDAGNTKTVTQSDITGTTVQVDTLAPVINLIGSANTTLILDRTYIDEGTVVTDNDPNYSNTPATPDTSGIDNAQLGQYTVTYSAQPDSAGNVPVTTTRNVTVVDLDPIPLTSLTIESSSGNTFANENKIITLKLVTVSNDLDSFTGTLLGRSFTNSTNGGEATFTTTVLSNDTNGNVTFSITATNSSGNVIEITDDNITDGSFVTIDTVKPIITLTGNSDDNVFRGETYTDESATVSDPNNSAYSETVTASITVDTSSLGPQNITYSAPADAAGNVPDSINRTVTVLAKPLDADTLTIVSNNAKNTSYAKDGDLITITLDANGTIGSATAEIASNTVTPTLTGGNLVATYTVDSTFGDTNSLEFKINITNQDATASKEFTQADLPNSSIIIDNTAPSIALVGNNNTLVATDTSYTDGGALASDTSFTSDITLTGSSTDFDITTPGNYTFTYTAEDRAGNIATITRAVEVRNAPPISINSFIINSDQSGNSKYAKAGDKLDFILNVNYSIVSYTVQIPNTATPTINPVTNRLFVTATVLDTSVESNATFTITVTNVNATTLTITENDLTGDNVFVDTISPRITPDGGPADYFIVNGTVPVIQNVTVTDGDPNYSGNYTLVTPNGIVDTSVNGSVFNYTYTADADAAGNPGDSLTRIITIIDADPIDVTSLTITSSSGDNFANADKTITVRLETDGTDLGNFTGTLLGRAIVKGDVNSGTTTFEATVSSNDANGNATFSIVATNSTGNRIDITNADITDGSFVIIDTVKPIIALNGNLADTALRGTSYVDLGATVSDPDNSAYSETVTASITVDTSSLGPQNITYSAPDDAAGNIPDSITRTVTVQAKPLDVETLTIVSNNAKNNSYAKDGDSITITLDANGTIGSATTIDIASSTITPTPTSDSFTVLYTVDSSLTDTNGLAFTITLYNEDNTTSRTFTQTSLSGSNIIIDNTAPSITLIGNNNTTVPTDSSYTDGGALASDTSFTSDITLTGSSTDFDITTPGNYTFTYTAEDKAGNTATITRAVEVRNTPPIIVNTFTINSNNANSTYAKTGDDLSLFLNVNNSIVSHTIQISNANVTDVTAFNNQLIITATVLDNPVESNIDFTITVTNSNGTTLTVTENDITSTSVFIDTIPPRIATDGDGPADYFIVNGTVPVIQNVTVTDEDPNYSGNYTLVTPNGIVDTSVNGSVFNYTYTADADTAGNPGDSLTRIITIIDADPIDVTSLTITSSSGDNFANADKTITVRLETDGTDLGNFTGTLLGRAIVKGDVNSGTTTFEATVSSNDANGNATFSIVATNSTGNRIDITNADITDGSFVIIDTVKPIIALNGNLADTVLQGTSYVDLGATVSDPDNSAYSETATASITVDISRLGAQLISYSAPADAAGNIPDSITRTVTVQAKPLDVETLTIVSNNAKNNSYAKDGDSITITLDANGTIGSATTIDIASSTITPTPTSDSFTVLYTVDSSLTDTNGLAFTITLYNEDNTTSRTFTQTSLSGSNIIIDNTAPSITLIGNNNTTVPTDSSYTDGGALASDTSFTSDITLTGSSTDFDITTPGNYTFTYTAEDKAGNTATITRAVQVKNTPPIIVNTFTINSNNANSTYAKTGDDLSLFLNVNNSIVSHTIQISNANVTDVTAFNNQLIITATVLDNPVESNIDFTITVTNSNGTTLTVTENDITSTSIFIDTIPPRITPDGGGSADYFLVNGTDPSIRNVTVTDGDPNYSGNYTLVTPNGIVDTSVNGSVFNYTYTADADTAGNPGDSLTRIITIIDAPLIGITSLSITSSPGNPNFANADNTINLRLQTDSNNLGNFTGTLLGKAFTSTTSGGTATFTVPVSSSDANGNVTFSIVATNSSGGRVSISESNLDLDSFVTIDTISPTISLNGENDTVVALGEDYTYLGATAYDLSYGNTQVSTTDRVNVNQLGHYTLHYTAPTDAAGNTGPTIIRIVEVLDAPPINITLFSITSDNSNNSYAKAGDTLSIQSSINYTIASYTATIFGIEQSESNQNSNGFLISQQVPSNLTIEDYASFSITIIDENGLPNTITQNTLITSSQLPPDNVFIDTVSPTVKLSTPQISISVNGVLPNITATITEKDPNYGEKTIAIPGSNISASDDVDIGTVGAYPYTYTAPDDNAGNPGQSATISIVVKNATLIENRTTILSSTVIKDAPQSFSDDIIIAEIHNDDGDSNNTLSLDAPIVELDVSDITNTAPGANNYITTYTHPLDLTVHNTISAQIELGTVLEFNTDDTTIRHNFTIHYVENDDPNDDVIRLGHTDIDYELDTHAIGITFERVRTPFNVSITNPSGVYVPVKSFEFTTTTENSANAWDILDGDSTYSGTLYTYDKSTRTVTVWTSHLSDVRLNSTSSSGGDESDSNSPTLGKASSGAQLVTNGFEYNGLTVNVGRYHTEFPLIGTNVGDINTIKMKVYDSAGPSGVKRVEFALGVPDIGLYHEAEAFVEVWMQRDSVAVQETIIVDELNLLEDSDVSATVSQTSCSGGEQQCLLVELQYSYREPPAYNTISIKPVDWDNNAHQFYFNDGIHVDGDSINLPKEITISASHAADTTHAGETLHLVQIDRAEHLWVDQYGYQWMIIGNTVRQITVPEYLVPNDNTYGTLHGPDRNHPEFASSVYAEQQRAQETLAEILGHATIIKPLPESGGTIYFDATGTDSRSGDSFKLLLELETARMHQLSNLLYDGTS